MRVVRGRAKNGQERSCQENYAASRRGREGQVTTIRERGSFKVIDKVGVKLNQKRMSTRRGSNLGIRDAVIPAIIVKQNEKLLTGGDPGASSPLNYFMKKGRKVSPFSNFTQPIQMPLHGYGGELYSYACSFQYRSAAGCD